MNPALLMLLTFLAVATVVVAIGSVVSDLFLRDRSRVSRRIDDEFRKQQRGRAEKALLFKDLGQAAAEFADAKPTIRQKLELLIEQSGLELTVRRLLTIAAGVALGAAAVGGLLVGSPLAMVGLAAVGAAAPLGFVAMKRNKRLEAMRGQLSDAFDLMARVVRAGQTMSQAQQAVADEFTPPLAAEFSYCYEQQNLGLSPEIALRDLARRTGLLEIKIFVTALMIQQQTGGNLAELLENLSQVVRERFKMQGKIKALTAEGRMQGLVLLFLPPGLYLIMLVLNWDFASVLLSYPMVFVGVAISELIGALWIRKIVNFDF